MTKKVKGTMKRTMKKTMKKSSRRNIQKHSNKTRKHHNKKLYRKRREIVIIPGSQSVRMFTHPEKKQPNKIMVDNSGLGSGGNIIPGLRNYYQQKI
jgi:hypothetical protein